MSDISTVFAVFNRRRATRSQIWIFLVFLTSISFLALSRSPSLRTLRYWSEFQLETPVDAPPPYTAVILYLVTLSRSSELLDSLASINTNLPGSSWPIVLFHTGDFDGEHERAEFITQVRGHIGREHGSFQFAERIEFVKLDWRLPEGITADKDIVEYYRWPGEVCAASRSVKLADSLDRLPPYVCLLCRGDFLHSTPERCNLLHAHGH